MFPIFSCSSNVTVTSQSDVPSFDMTQKAFRASAVYTQNNHVLVLFIALKWLKSV